MKAQLNDFVPGRILYHVYGVDRTNTIVNESEVNKLIIASKPYEMTFDDQKYLFVEVINCYINCEGKESSYITKCSLNDMGVDTGTNRGVYNLNRAFTSKEAAMKFLAELRADEFSDPVDQKYAKGFTSADQERQHQEWLEDEREMNDYYFGHDE